MNLELALGLFVAVCTLITGAWALVKIVVSQFEKRLDERFAMQEEARVVAQRSYNERFLQIEENSRKQERELLQLKADLPVRYVARDDSIRQEVAINAKLDALNARQEQTTMQLAVVAEWVKGLRPGSNG